MVETGRFALLEHFAQQVADLLLADDKAVEVSVEILKLRPPDGPGPGRVGRQDLPQPILTMTRRAFLGLGSNLANGYLLAHRRRDDS